MSRWVFLAAGACALGWIVLQSPRGLGGLPSRFLGRGTQPRLGEPATAQAAPPARRPLPHGRKHLLRLVPARIEPGDDPVEILLQGRDLDRVAIEVDWCGVQERVLIGPGRLRYRLEIAENPAVFRVKGTEEFLVLLSFRAPEPADELRALSAATLPGTQAAATVKRAIAQFEQLCRRVAEGDHLAAWNAYCDLDETLAAAYGLADTELRDPEGFERRRLALKKRLLSLGLAYGTLMRAELYEFADGGSPTGPRRMRARTPPGKPGSRR